MPYLGHDPEIAVGKSPQIGKHVGQVAISDAAPVKRSVKELPPGAGPIMEEARRAAEAGRFEEAEKKFQDILRQDEEQYAAVA